MVRTTVLSPATQQILFAFEMQLTIRNSMSCPHFYSCQSSQEHTAHGAFLVAFLLGFNINIVPSSLPSAHQIHSKFNLSFKWHEVPCPPAGRELQCLTAVSYVWAWSSRSALKLIKSVSASFKWFLLATKDSQAVEFCFLLQRFLEVISDCRSCRCNGCVSLHRISVLMICSIRLVLFRAVANLLLVRVRHRGKRTALTNATATQGSGGREQVLGARLFRTWSLWFFPTY